MRRKGYLSVDGQSEIVPLRRLSPIQRFRWIHFPYNIDTPGYFRYRITPAFMTGEGDAEHSLSYGEVQEVKIEL